jgi:preprotein translocase SecE subunit
MAVAVKNTSETTEPSLMDRLAVRSLLGVVYILVSFALVFFVLPYLWGVAVSPTLRGISPFVDVAVLLAVLVAAAVGVVWLGLRLVGPSPPAGLKGGIFWGLASLAIAGTATWAIGMMLDSWFGASGIDPAGQAVVGAIGLLILALAARWYFKPAREDFFVRFEEQGWLSTTQYKKSQGLKVRRGTMIGLLLIAAAGIWTMLSHELLARTAWTLPVPFTGMAEIRAVGDADHERFAKGWWYSRNEFEQQKQRVAGLVKVTSVGDANLDVGQVMPKSQFDDEVKKQRSQKARAPVSAPATEPTASIVYAWRIWMLPDMNYTVPLILTILGVWLSWRVVNYPPFADFLIATEAELNKVSWSSRKRLVQDTIVVLVTLILFTVFLMVVDMAWGWLLTRVGVLPAQQTNQQVDKDQSW